MKNKKIENILIIRFRRVGDAVISSVLCSTLKQTFPSSRIDYVLNEGIAPLFEHHPDIDKLITFNESEVSSCTAYIRKIRRIMKQGKYDLIIDTRSTIKTLWFSLFSLSTPYRTGRKKPYNKLLHNLRSEIDFKATDDEVDKTLRLLQPLEKYFKLNYQRKFKLYVTDNEKADFRQYMTEKGIRFDRPVIVCAVTARLEHKRWKKEYMQEILQRIIDRFDAQLIFNYAGDEKEYAVDLFEKMNKNPHVFIDIEAKGLRQLSALFANSHFFFGNEGGPRHISQAFEVPGFAIYSPGISKTAWLPNACDRYQGIEPSDISSQTVQQKMSYQEKFDLITVDEVWKRLKPCLINNVAKDFESKS